MAGIVSDADGERMDEREFWMILRSALLLVVDAIERRLGLPRSAALRKKAIEG